MHGTFRRSHGLQALLLLAAIAAPVVAGPYWVHVGALAWYYALLAASWALLRRLCRAVLVRPCRLRRARRLRLRAADAALGLPLALSIPLTVILAMVFGALMGALVLRLSGPYLALFTLAIAEIFRLMLVAEENVTRGSLGLEVPGLFPGGSDVPYYYLGLALVVLALLAMNGLLATRVGLFLRAIREDEHAAQASGVNTTLHKIIVFVITAGIAALAGIYYGHFVGILSPNMVILPEMGLVIAMAVIGGIESLPGAVAGAVIVYALSEILRDYGEWRFVLLGLALILVQRFAQNGLFPVVERYLDRRVAPHAKSPFEVANVPNVEGDYAKPS